MPNPYFSVIIPALNEEQYLPHLLENLNQQIFKDFEVLVIDGHSDDKTPQLVSAFPAVYPLTLLTTAKRNVSYQRNLGAQKAKGNIFVFFDADTQIPKNYLGKIRQAFETKHPHVLSTWVKSESHLTADRTVVNGMNIISETSRLLGKPTGCGAMIVVKRGAFEDVGGFDEHTPYAEDTQLQLKLQEYNYKYVLLRSPRYVYSLRRFHKEGTFDAAYQFMKISLNLLKDGFHDQKPDYPMGGHVFDAAKTGTQSITPFQTFFKTVKTASPDKKKALKTLFEALFPTP